MLNLEWFTQHNFAASYAEARRKKKMLVSEKTKQIMANFEDRKDAAGNPIVEIHGTDGLLMISRIVNFEHELRRLPQDVPVNLQYEGRVIARLGSIRELWQTNS